MKIPLKPKKRCIICQRYPDLTNPLLRFHISYSPEMVVIACKNCNYIEYCLRNKKAIPFLKRNVYTLKRPSRAECVISYLKKFNIIYDF